ncbi:MAG: ubiquinol-cytochrome c reductase iron-sulfur subunit [Gemmataceae bacterium]
MSEIMQPAPETPPEPPDRRNVLKYLSVALGSLAALVVAIPYVGYLFGALLKFRPDEWIDLGEVSQFPVNQTILSVFANPLRQPWDGFTANYGVYVRNLGNEQFLVLAVNCTHLGCPVEWFPQSGLFMCPCHGGVYYENGEHASGPPPRGLYHYPWKIENGRLMIKGGHLPTLQDTFEKPAGA